MTSSSLLFKRRFAPLFWTQFLGAFNDNVLKNALVILITFKSSQILGLVPEQMVALCGGLFILPFFLFSATAGQLADKYDKSFLIRVIKFVEILIMILAFAGFWFEHIEFLLAVLFLMGLHSTFFGPLKYSALPQLLKPLELLQGNGLIEMGTFLAILLGTISGGLLISLQPHGPLIVSGLLLAMAIAGWLTSRRIPPLISSETNLVVNYNPIPPTWEAMKFAREDRLIFHSINGISWFWGFGAAILSLFPPFCKEVLHTTEAGVTLFLALFSIGIGLGSILCATVSRGRLDVSLVPVGAVGMTVFTADLFVVSSSPFLRPAGVLDLVSSVPGLRICADLLLLSVFSGFFIVPLYTMMQQRSDLRRRSRIISANNVVNALYMVVASVAIIALSALNVTVPQMFLIFAILNALVGIALVLVVPEFTWRWRRGGEQAHLALNTAADADVSD